MTKLLMLMKQHLHRGLVADLYRLTQLSVYISQRRHNTSVADLYRLATVLYGHSSNTIDIAVQ